MAWGLNDREDATNTGNTNGTDRMGLRIPDSEIRQVLSSEIRISQRKTSGFDVVVKFRLSLGQPDEAVAVCDDGLKIAPVDAELPYRIAVALRSMGAGDEVETRWNQIRTLKRPERISSVDVGIYGHLPRRNLARIAEEKHDARKSPRLREEVLQKIARMITMLSRRLWQ